MNAPVKTTSLHEISSTYLQALDQLTDPENDMPLEAVTDTMEALEGELSDKAVCVVQYMRNIETTASAIKEAERKMAERRRIMDKRESSLKQYVHDSMQHTGITKIESPWFALAIQNCPPSVQLHSQNVEANYRKVTIEMPADQWERIQDQAQVFAVKSDIPDKIKIKEVLKAGGEVKNAELLTNTRLAIRGGSSSTQGVSTVRCGQGLLVLSAP